MDVKVNLKLSHEINKDNLPNLKNKAIFIYKNFYKWLLVNIKENKINILDKGNEYCYLIKSYDQLLDKINKQNNDDINKKLMSFSEKDTKILKYYIKSIRTDYKLFDKNKNKEFKYYNNLISWYQLNIDALNDLIEHYGIHYN